MNEQRADELLNRINAADARRAVDSADCLLEEFRPDFYRNGTLVELTDYGPMLPLTRSFVATRSELIPLDGSVAAVQRANRAAGLHLTEGTVLTYCRFWFRAVHGPEDSFKLVERLEDVEFTGEVDRDTRDALAVSLRPAQVYRAGNGYRVEAFVLYADTLYRATLAVGRDGCLDVADESVIRENVPTRDILLE